MVTAMTLVFLRLLLFDSVIIMLRCWGSEDSFQPPLFSGGVFIVMRRRKEKEGKRACVPVCVRSDDFFSFSLLSCTERERERERASLTFIHSFISFTVLQFRFLLFIIVFVWLAFEYFYMWQLLKQSKFYKRNEILA